jgi:hypothetical protein
MSKIRFEFAEYAGTDKRSLKNKEFERQKGRQTSRQTYRYLKRYTPIHCFFFKILIISLQIFVLE